MALIRYAAPIRGKRELMCSTDEARVSRIRAPGSMYDGMVERLQVVPKQVAPERIQQFGLIYHQERPPHSPYSYTFLQSKMEYHLMKFLATRAARSLFPDNFVDLTEIRIIQRRMGTCAATYSGFVSDDTGVIERRKKTMRDYYMFYEKTREEKMGHAFDFAMDEFVELHARSERDLNPGMERLADRISDAGIVIAHPEANYHVSNGSTVFFEIYELDMRKTASTALATGAAHAIEAVSAIHAMNVLGYASSGFRDMGRHSDPVKRDMFKEVVESKPEAIFDLIFYAIIAADKGMRSARDVFCPPDVFIKTGISHWRMVSERVHGFPGCPEHSRLEEIIDAKSIALLKGG